MANGKACRFSLMLPEPPPTLCTQLSSEPATFAIPNSEIHVLNSSRQDAAVLEQLARSRDVIVDGNLCGSTALGMSTLDLLRILSLNGTTLTLLSIDDQKRPGGGGGNSRQADEALAFFSKAVRLSPQCQHMDQTPGIQEESRLRECSGSIGGDKDGGAPTLVLRPSELPANDTVQTCGGELPHVAIVSIVYRKLDTLEMFLAAVYRQNYPGPVTVVLVNDRSEPDTFAGMEAAIARLSASKPSHIAVHTVQNRENLGNCLSRNAGISSCNADAYVLIDVDCLMNGDFIRAHVSQHLISAADAIVGPYNIETNGERGDRLLLQLEYDRSKVVPLANLQDSVNPAGFVNTVTRNLSIKKSWFDAHGMFDPALSYSGKPDTGYGWEDVEIGARIYATGGLVSYTEDAFSIHISHGTSQSENVLVRGSARNFCRLASKHEVIRLAARRWWCLTAEAIVAWGKSVGAKSPDLAALETELGQINTGFVPVLPYFRRQKPRLRILTHRWHVPHQYEIYKLPFDFTLVTGTGTGFTNQWSFDQRPLRPNVRFINAEDVSTSHFDLAIIHFDENVLCTDLSNGVLDPRWGATFEWFLDNVKIPRIAVCHGTVPFVGQYGATAEPIDKFEIYDADVVRLRRNLAQVPVVVNSHQAADEWKFDRMRVIWHGYDPQEFRAGRHDLDIVSHGVDPRRPHYRGTHELRAVLQQLAPRIKMSSHTHRSHVPVPTSDARFPDFKFQNWLEHVGRHKIYLNTTLRSPMPRSRTEAMLCGTIPVSLDNHDVSRFIRNGVNGFYSASVDELADYCNFICGNDDAFEKTSGMARSTAMDLFNHDRFLAEWISLITDTLEGAK